MLEIYMSTIFLWMIIIFCAVNECHDKVISNGWMDKEDSKSGTNDMLDIIKALIVLVLLSSIPVVRALMVAGFYIMSKYTEDQVNEWIKKFDKK